MPTRKHHFNEVTFWKELYAFLLLPVRVATRCSYSSHFCHVTLMPLTLTLIRWCSGVLGERSYDGTFIIGTLKHLTGITIPKQHWTKLFYLCCHIYIYIYVYNIFDFNVECKSCFWTQINNKKIINSSILMIYPKGVLRSHMLHKAQHYITIRGVWPSLLWAKWIGKVHCKMEYF